MKNIILAVSLVVIASSAYAGPQLEALKADIATYQQEQSKNPNHIINYSDENGAVVRSILDPSRLEKVCKELSGEINQPASFKTLSDAYQPVLKNYGEAFTQVPGKYDAEYIDSTDLAVRMLMHAMRPLQAINLSTITDPNMKNMLEAVQKLAISMPGIVLKLFGDQIKANKFTPEYAPVAAQRLAALQDLQKTLLNPGPPPPATPPAVLPKDYSIETYSIPETFDAIPLSSSGAFDFAKGCLPRISQLTFQQTADATQKPGTISEIKFGRNDPYLILEDGQAFCMKMSEKGYPILPIAAFNGTVGFNYGLHEDEKALWTDVSTQIANSGTATVLVVNGIGDADQITFSLPSNQPLKFDYQLKLNNLKKGTFSESSFSSVYHLSGNITLTSYGNPKKTSKPICAQPLRPKYF